MQSGKVTISKTMTGAEQQQEQALDDQVNMLTARLRASHSAFSDEFKPDEIKQQLSAARAVYGKLIATGSWDSTVRLWRAADWQSLRELKEPKVPVVSVAFSSDSKQLAVGRSDKTVQILEADPGPTLNTINTKSYPLSVSF
jgi:WD40 repeat protein